MAEVSLIVPTYNESKNLPLFIDEVFSFVDKSNIKLNFIVVDDNSPDGTGKIAEELSIKYPIKVIHRFGKLGLGSAVIEGFKNSDSEYLGVMDADLSHDPVIINDLINSLAEYDIVIGSRFVRGSSVENWQWWRKILSKFGVFLARKLTGIKDPLSGYFFLNKKVIEGVNLETVGYKILFEILVKGRYSTVKEIPFRFRMRKYSSSKLNYKEYYYFLKQILKYILYKIK